MMKNKSVLVIVAHPDDEVLGCGGTIAYFSSLEYSVNLLVMSDGVSSRTNSNNEAKELRKKALNKSGEILGIDEIFLEDFPDNTMDSVPLISIINKIESVVNSVKPSVVFTHHSGDMNIDHQLTHKAVMTACRPTPELSVKEIYTFEVISSTDWGFDDNKFTPNFFVDISSYLDLKMKALEVYGIEMRDSPHSRSKDHCRSLAIHRGHSVGLNAAEAFMAIRILF